MKLNKYGVLTILILLVTVVLASRQRPATAQFADPQLRLTVAAGRSSYAAGEVVDLAFELANETGETAELAPPSVRSGTLRLFIAADGGDYREYVGPGWGALDGFAPPVKLAPGARLDADATALYHRRTPTEHLTEMYAERIRRKNLDTAFALRDAGRYRLKAVYADGRTRLESAPVALDIAEPAGADAAIWEEIKDDGACAYFLQTGEVVYRRDAPEREKFVENLRRLAADHPASLLGGAFGRHLTRFDAAQDYLRQLERSRPE